MVQIQKINFSYLKDLKEAVCEYRLFSFYTFAFNKFSATLNFSQPINHLLAVVAILPITHVNPEGCALDARTLEDELVKLLIHQPTQPLTTYCRGWQYDVCCFTNEVLTLAHTAHRLVERRTTVTRTDDDGTTGILAQGL